MDLDPRRLKLSWKRDQTRAKRMGRAFFLEEQEDERDGELEALLKSCAIHLKCFETELTKQLKR